MLRLGRAWMLLTLFAVGTVPAVASAHTTPPETQPSGYASPTPQATPQPPGQPTPAATQTVQQVQFDTSRFDVATAHALRGLFEVAAEAGLPTRPLINRALEGAARRISGDRILKVVREFTTALNEAREILGQGSSTDELVAGADALRAGYDARSVAGVRANRPMGTAAPALIVMTDLASRGVPTTTARDAVTALAKLGRSDEALWGLQSAVAKNAPRGPGMALDALNRYLRGTVPNSPGSISPGTTDRKPVRPPDS